jgi:hypothetical protein
MIQLGHFILICIVMIIYLIWSYYSIKDIFSMNNKISNSISDSTGVWFMLTCLILLILFFITINYLNKYTIP